MKIKIIDNLHYAFISGDDIQPVEVNNNILQEIGKTLQFTDKLGNTAPYTPQLAPKIDYDNLVNSKIRAKYSESQEFAILRQQDRKTAEFQEYDNYCEQCKKEARKELGL